MTMTCDCGYSFVDGSPPRFSRDAPKLGGTDFGSRMMTRLAIRLAVLAFGLGMVLVIRTCG
jgi:hypothetical protein